jgi:hypothetical protein
MIAVRLLRSWKRDLERRMRIGHYDRQLSADLDRAMAALEALS